MVLVGDDSFIGEASFVEMTPSMVRLVAADLKRENGPSARACG